MRTCIVGASAEMISGRKPFEGETPSDTMAAILKTEPTPLPHIVPQLPSELVRIVTKSLRKDREERYQVVKDLWLDLKALKQELDKEIVPAAQVGYFGITFSPDGNDLYYAVKVNLDAGALYRIPVLGGLPVKVIEKIDGPISFSPDGKRFVLIRGNRNVWSQSLDGIPPKQVTDFKDSLITGFAWYKDGKMFAASRGSLIRDAVLIADAK